MVDFELSPMEILDFVAQSLRVSWKVDAGEAVFDLTRVPGGREIRIGIPEIVELLGKLEKFEIHDELAIQSETSYEVLVREESSFYRRAFREDGFSLVDQDNGCNFQLGKPSREYILFLILSICRGGGRRGFPLMSSMTAQRIFQEEEAPDILDFFARVWIRSVSLRITSNGPKPKGEFHSLRDAFIFQLSYNLDSPLVPQRYLEEIIRTSRITRLRRGRLQDIDPPRRRYISDIVYHYQLGVASDSPVLEYISYYHVAEHFFEAVFTDDLINTIKNSITSPDFSYRRRKDVHKLITTIGKALQVRNDSISFNELNALVLTLKRYVSLGSVRSKIEDYDPELIGYYSGNKVSFSDGSPVNFDDEEDRVFRSIAGRIYSTRNSIVHSKDGEKARFEPFKHDRVLVKEIPLIRFVAEEIIIATSHVIE